MDYSLVLASSGCISVGASERLLDSSSAPSCICWQIDELERKLEDERRKRVEVEQQLKQYTASMQQQPE